MFRKRIGFVPVDSGQIFISDPTFLNDWQQGDYPSEETEENSYSRVTTLMLNQGYGNVENGVVVGNFGGDGVYFVYVTEDEEGNVLKAEIVFREEALEGNEVEG